jgi:MFS family permease
MRRKESKLSDVADGPYAGSSSMNEIAAPLRSQARATGAREFASGWPILVLAFSGMAFGVPAMAIYGIGLFVPQFVAAFGWSFASAGLALAIVNGVLLFVAPAGGYLLDRFGTFRVAAVSVPIVSLSYLSLAFEQGSLLQYYLSWALVAFGAAGTSAVAWSRLISRVFEQRRGLALGIAFSGTGFFVFVLKPVIAYVIAHHGWRAGMVVQALMPLLLLWPLVFLVLGRASLAPATSPAVASEAGLIGISIEEAFHSWRYWLFVFAALLTGVFTAILPHLENIIHHLGYTIEKASYLASTLGIAMICGRLVGGYLADRFWAPGVFAFFMFTAAVATAGLAMHLANTPVVLAIVLLFGLSVGSEVHLLGFVAAKYVGLRHFGVLYGLCFAPPLFLGGLGAGLIGGMFDRYKDYGPSLWVCCGILLLLVATLLQLGPYPTFEPCNERKRTS